MKSVARYSGSAPVHSAADGGLVMYVDFKEREDGLTETAKALIALVTAIKDHNEMSAYPVELDELGDAEVAIHNLKTRGLHP